MAQPDPSTDPAVARFQDAGLVVVRKFLPRSILDFLRVYFRIQAMNGKLKPDSQAPLSLSVYGDPALDAFLDFVGPEMRRRVGRDLVPAVSYARIYMKGDVLVPHTDRPSCEVSVSICLATPAGADPSPLYFRRSGRRARKVTMREGDACIYRGAEIEHWRDPFPEGGHIQLFLHYIDRNGPHFPALRFDGRPRLGMPYEDSGPAKARIAGVTAAG
jgi:hypothetical protein